MMQHHTAPCHKPSLLLSSMELVLSPSYASAANSSITGSSASASAIEASASASTSGGVPSSSSLSSSKKKSGNHDNHEEDNDNLSFHPSPVGSSIPHLLSTDCDNDSDDDDNDHYDNGRHAIGRGSYEEGFIASSARSNSLTHLGNGAGSNEDGEGNDQFQSMLLDQQRQADEPCLDDSVIYHHQHGSHDADSQFTYPTQTASSLPPPSSSPPLEDDVESSMSLLQTNEERSHYFHRQHRDNHNRTSTGKKLLSKFSRSADTSRQQTWEVVPPITMMIDLDDNDEDLPWMLSQPGFGVIDAAGTRGNSYDSSGSGGSDGNGDEEDGRTSPLENEQQPSTTTLPTHRRYPSSLSSTSSQSSFRSILRNGINSSGSAESSRQIATTSSSIGPASTASNCTPLIPRSNYRYDQSVAAGVLEDAGSDLRRVGAREEPESLMTLGSSTGRGRSIHVQDHQTNRGLGSKCHSAQKSKRIGDAGSALSVHVASSSTGKDCHSHQHRRSVSFPAELIAKDDKSCKTAPRHPRRDGSKSPRSLPPPGSQYDPNLTPLLDMGSSRTRKKLPAHVIQNVSEISPRTADFLAHEPVAVTTLCKLQDRERYGHLLGPSTSSRATPAATATVPPSPSNSNWGCNTYPPPAVSSHSPAKRLNASYQRKLQFETSDIPGGSRRGPTNSRGNNQEDGIDNDYLSPSSKLAVFSFSHGNRRGRVLSSSNLGRRRKRLSNVDLLSPVEEIGASIAGSTTTSMATTPRVTGQDKQPYSLPARRNNIDNQPSFASDGSCEVRSGSISVSPLTSELQKAADAVWRDAETSPSSASASASASASSKSSFTVVGTQCQCIIS